MRCLWLNRYVFPNDLNADSCYLLTRSIIGAVVRERPDTYFTIPIPEGATWRDEPFPGRDHVEFVRVAGAGSDLGHEFLDQFDPTDGDRVAYDVVIANTGLVLDEYMARIRGKLFAPPVILLEYFNVFGEFQMPEGDARQYVLNAAACAHVFLFSEWARTSLLDAARQILAPALVNDLIERSSVLPIAFDADRVDHWLPREKYLEFTVYFGGRFTKTKGGELALKLMDYVHCSGLPIQTKVTTSSRGFVGRLGSNVGLRKSLGRLPVGVDFHLGYSQDSALSVMIQSHVAVYPQPIILMPAGVFEQIAAGLVVLVHRFGLDRILPTYPYAFDSLAEAWDHLQFIYHHYDEALFRMRPFQQMVRDRYSVEANVGTLLNVADETSVVARSAVIAHPLYRKEIRYLREPIGWPALWDRVSSESFWKNFRRHYRATRNASKWALFQTFSGMARSFDETAALDGRVFHA